MTDLEGVIENIERSISDNFLDKAILESSSALVIDMETWKILKATSTAEKTFGYLMEGSLQGVSLEKLIPETFREKHKEYVTNFSKNPRPATMASGQRRTKGLKRNEEVFDITIRLHPKIISRRQCVIAHIIDMEDEY